MTRVMKHIGTGPRLTAAGWSTPGQIPGATQTVLSGPRHTYRGPDKALGVGMRGRSFWEVPLRIRPSTLPSLLGPVLTRSSPGGGLGLGLEPRLAYQKSFHRAVGHARPRSTPRMGILPTRFRLALQKFAAKI